ncbi:pyridine nucleotide-disulfide oxidoreductase [Pseudoclavibacter sp. RFBJ3]|uniref:NAD(P)/FAD-dependent oxidoreductase n=1 Tax=unclassified Pseudoclavibacter TaxID=2615177 RepID=UPI000CE7EC46|nr:MULTISPECIES: FAD/NAD(P)-binding oxidoreductase [unclassified Pseudoclavibacter]PPF80175.1 pyridine nucleotide-disulfide oxidoreductase [Pseudoclavibacter sp. RFBJ5]PPF89149.1 pyridine nucleotide-disulfide oxidoreductase [Pseudoclavibacter sp. RFBJ3]PPF95774.1 pyridine nucleotide-disulfide oxidoreductase [Pseudoclavibacter sp. RFBH5]PPG25925.1 pyridine nucleotide-disulfide oxidoreductase [Pseudoclavibacter sp. RFBI4]
MTTTSNGDAQPTKQSAQQAAKQPTQQPTLTTYRVLVIGGGNAGLSVAGRLQRAGIPDITVIEPRVNHVYQPMLSHVAGGTAKASQATRPQADVMPTGVTLLRDAVASVDPETSSLVLESGRRVGYEHLIVCPGIVQDWDAIPGLRAALQSPRVASSYEIGLADKTSHLLRDLRDGTAVFVQAPEPASFAGAIQKPMYLACDYWRARGVLDRIRVVLVLPDATPLGVPEIDAELERKVAEYGIEVRRESRLNEVIADSSTAVIGRATLGTTAGVEGEPERIHYDALVVEPPQRAPAWIAEAGLAAAVPLTDSEGGFVDVDGRTLQHRRHPNVWSLGDAAVSGSQRSGGALRKQTKALAENLVGVLGGNGARSEYDGYTVAPFTVSRSSVVFAEFDADGQQRPSIPFWKGLARERRLTWVFDRRVLPWVYWNLILKGRA